MDISSKVIIILIFVLAGVLFFHNLVSINVDVGRHIKFGELMWQTKDIPNTNLFSFTAPDHPFINHHWLSEVVFYGIFSLGSNWLSGLRSLMLFKIAILLVVYLLLFLTVRRRSIFAIVLSFLFSVFVFSARTEPRPEIFSYLIFSAYLFVIYKVRENRISNFKFQIFNQSFNNLIFKLRNYKIYSKLEIKNLQFNWLWLLPLLQLLWVNLHIYFIIGPMIFLIFLIDRFVNQKFKNYNFIQNSKLEIKIFLLVILVNFVNPNFIAGALYPLKVLNNYGYSVAENSSLFFLAKYFGHWTLQDKLFLISLCILAGSFVVSFWVNKITTLKLATSNVFKNIRCPYIKTRIFDLLLVAITAVLSFKMQRNIPLYALSLWPVMAKNLDDFSNFAWPSQPKLLRRSRQFLIFNFEKLKKWFYACTVFVLMASVYLVVSNRFYNWLDSAKIFGLGVSSAAQDGTDFLKANKIQGPVFNNFDIGSYLVWQLFPDQKVFVDGRPEAYPVEFFDKIYKPMQRDEKVWQELSGKYDLNYIFFAHTDMTEWANEFLIRISKDNKWPMVFVNDAVVIFVKDNDANGPVIDKHKITDKNIEKKTPQILDRLKKNDLNAFVNFGNILSRFHWLDASAKVFETLVANQPNNPYGYQGAAYAYATMNDPATQEKAAQNFEKTIDLGFKTFNNYFTLGIIKANLGNLVEAKANIKKALQINPDNQNAKAVLEIIRRKVDLK